MSEGKNLSSPEDCSVCFAALSNAIGVFYSFGYSIMA